MKGVWHITGFRERLDGCIQVIFPIRRLRCGFKPENVPSVVVGKVRVTSVAEKKKRTEDKQVSSNPAIKIERTWKDALGRWERHRACRVPW
jgi:hypothetical protein